MGDQKIRAFLDQLGAWEGFEVVAVTTEDTLAPDVLGQPAARLIIRLEPTAGVPKRCSRCGAVVVEVHDTSERRVRDLPFGPWDTWLVFPRPVCSVRAVGRPSRRCRGSIAISA